MGPSETGADEGEPSLGCGVLDVVVEPDTVMEDEIVAATISANSRQELN
jgi:hypothetical protein